jgi:hypothetical protein
MKHIADINTVKGLLNKPASKVHFESPEGMIESLKQKKQIITLHVYRPFIYKHSDSLGDLADSTYNQVYVAVDDKSEPSSIITNSQSSGRREHHNHMLEVILADDALKKMDTMIVVLLDRKILAYYHHPSFAYVNHDIGSNWNKSIRGKVEDSELPYSEFYGFPDHKFDVLFHDGNDELIYRAYGLDSTQRRFDEHIQKIRGCKK